ncbi:MAG: recombinase family protein [Alphaproteobacteria bacterium]|nr:recombinase family protein [Alphaproteobacteria bacterium]
MAKEDKKPIRCAIYTRKSTQEGLEQEFNSLDAQREAGEAYIKSQKHENWTLIPKHYDDGGFSGGSMDRPALYALIADIKKGLIDVVVVYMRMLEEGFRQEFDVTLFAHDIDDEAAMQHISRFASKDRTALLRLAKELIRVFSDRLDVRVLRKLSTHAEKEKFGSNRLLQDILAKKVGDDKARKVFSAIVGTYDMRLGDAHPTSSKIGEALKLAGINESNSFLRQGEQLISNFGHSIWQTGKLLFKKP